MQRIFLILSLLICAQSSIAQLTGFQVPKGKTKIEIPFRFQNNFILVDVLFNDTYPLTFIFDTGSESTILIKKTYVELRKIKYDREYKVYGSDFQRELIVRLAKGMNMELPKLPAKNVPILVLDDDYYKFERYTGLKIHGILGMDLFRLVVIQIDYDKQKIILHRPEHFKAPSKKFIKFPVEVYRNKVYIDTKGAIQNEATNLKLLMDTGANISLLLHNNSDSTIALPSKLIPGKLGDGLGGFIEGYMGRTRTLSVGDFEFNNVVTNFQELPEGLDSVYINGRNGILGNALLSRFNVIFTPYSNTVYLRPEKNYNRGFKFDRSGLVIVASGFSLNRFTVLDVIPNSPAAEAGIQEGDHVLRINGMPTKFMGLESITRKFQKKVGKRFQLVILRDGEKQRMAISLRDLI